MLITNSKIKIMCYHHLEMSWALNREDEHDGVICQEDSGEFGLIARCGGPNPFLPRNFYVSNVAALHNEVTCWWADQLRNWFWDLLGISRDITIMTKITFYWISFILCFDEITNNHSEPIEWLQFSHVVYITQSRLYMAASKISFLTCQKSRLKLLALSSYFSDGSPRADERSLFSPGSSWSLYWIYILSYYHDRPQSLVKQSIIKMSDK